MNHSISKKCNCVGRLLSIHSTLSIHPLTFIHRDIISSSLKCHSFIFFIQTPSCGSIKIETDSQNPRILLVFRLPCLFCNSQGLLYAKRQLKVNVVGYFCNHISIHRYRDYEMFLFCNIRDCPICFKKDLGEWPLITLFLWMLHQQI